MQQYVCKFNPQWSFEWKTFKREEIHNSFSELRLKFFPKLENEKNRLQGLVTLLIVPENQNKS